MNIKVITLPFDVERQEFDARALEEFCRNKRIIRQEAMHFMQGERPFWSVLIEYEIVLDPDNAEQSLSRADKLLYIKLKEWRRAKAHAQTIPPFLVATNKQLLEMITRKIQTINGFDNIKGFGKTKIERYGKEIIELISNFYKNGQTK